MCLSPGTRTPRTVSACVLRRKPDRYRRLDSRYVTTAASRIGAPFTGSSSTLCRRGESHQACRAIARTTPPAATATLLRVALPSRHPSPAPPTAVIAQWLHHAPPTTRLPNENSAAFTSCLAPVSTIVLRTYRKFSDAWKPSPVSAP